MLNRLSSAMIKDKKWSFCHLMNLIPGKKRYICFQIRRMQTICADLIKKMNPEKQLSGSCLSHENHLYRSWLGRLSLVSAK